MLSFGQVSASLANLIGVIPDREPRFQARLKQLQRMGIPTGANVGRYAKASYSPAQLFQLAFCLELIQAGMSPERAKATIDTFWTNIQKAVLQALSGGIVVIAFLPKDFGGLTDEDKRIAWTAKGVTTFKWSGPEDPDLPRETLDLLSSPRAVSLNVSMILESIQSTIPADTDQGRPFWRQVRGWRPGKTDEADR